MGPHNRVHLLCPLCQTNTKGRLLEHLKRSHKDLDPEERLKINHDARYKGALAVVVKKDLSTRWILRKLHLTEDTGSACFHDILALLRAIGHHIIHNHRINPQDVLDCASKLSSVPTSSTTMSREKSLHTEKSVTYSSAETLEEAPSNLDTWEAELMQPGSSGTNLQQSGHVRNISEIASVSEDQLNEMSYESKTTDWKSGSIKGRLQSTGCYKMFDPSEPILAKFSGYMKAVKKMKGKRQRTQIVSRVSKILKSLCGSGPLDVKCLEKKEQILEFIDKLRNQEMKAVSIKNYLDNLETFVTYLRTGTRIFSTDHAFHNYLLHLSDCLQQWNTANSKTVRMDNNYTRYAMAVSQKGIPSIECTKETFFNAGVRARVAMALYNHKCDEGTRQDLVDINGYISAWICLVQGHRSGVAENLKLGEYENARMAEDNWVIYIQEHKTGSTQCATLCITPNVKRDIFDRYLENVRPKYDRGLTDTFLLNSNGKRIRNISQILNALQGKLAVPKATATMARKAIQTAAVDEAIPEDERDRLCGQLAHSRYTAEKSYVMATVKQAEERFKSLQKLQKSSEHKIPKEKTRIGNEQNTRINKKMKSATMFMIQKCRENFETRTGDCKLPSTRQIELFLAQQKLQATGEILKELLEDFRWRRDDKRAEEIASRYSESDVLPNREKLKKVLQEKGWKRESLIDKAVVKWKENRSRLYDFVDEEDITRLPTAGRAEHKKQNRWRSGNYFGARNMVPQRK